MERNLVVSEEKEDERQKFKAYQKLMRDAGLDPVFTFKAWVRNYRSRQRELKGGQQ